MRLTINTPFRPPSVAFDSYKCSQLQPNEQTNLAQPSEGSHNTIKCTHTLLSHHFIKIIRNCNMFLLLKGHIQGIYLTHSTASSTKLILKKKWVRTWTQHASTNATMLSKSDFFFAKIIFFQLSCSPKIMTNYRTQFH
jgi:hypothetical protein